MKLKFKINMGKFAENYKEIIKECKLSGYAPPQYLRDLSLNLPNEYKFTLKEQEEINKSISSKAKFQLEEMYCARRKEDVNIIHIEDEIGREKYLKGLYESELEDFFTKFPQFKIILEN